MRELETRSLARVEKRASLDSIVIDSSNLAGYLIAGSFVARESQLTSELDLVRYYPLINRLYDEKKEGFVLPEEIRANALGLTEWIRNHPQRLNLKDPLIEEFIHDLEARANMVSPVERASVVYFDSEKKLITASPIKFGMFTEVEYSAPDVLEDGHRAMIEIHTHPYDSLFSLNDYCPMLIDVGEGTPLVKSIMVLCPNIQVLALITRRSPLIDVDEVGNFLDKLENSDENISLKSICSDDSLDVDILSNGRFLAIARALNVKLYSSTDRRHFKAFSA